MQLQPLIEDAHLTQLSVGKRWAQVSILMQNGTQYDAAPSTPRGDTDLPLSDAEISEKFHHFSDHILGSRVSKKIEELATKFDELNAREVQSLLDLILTKPKSYSSP